MRARAGRPIVFLAVLQALLVMPVLVAMPVLFAIPARGADPFDLFEPAERAMILSHGPWPPPLQPDAGNRASGDPAAIALGARLFVDRGLSRDGSLACADCHRPGHGFADDLPVAVGRDMGAGQGRAALDRNTPGLRDLRFQRWFGWDGASDSIWAANLRAMTSDREMAAGPQQIRAALAERPAVAAAFQAAFGSPPDALPAEAAMVLAAKAIAAWLETLVSPRTPFDTFRDALAAGDRQAALAYPPAARRGLKLFVGKGRCSLCHFGPTFSNGEFADAGIPFFLPGGGVDKGRYGGIQVLHSSPFSLTGRYNDAAGGGNAWATRGVSLEHRHFGAFRVPSLRGLPATAPYMHNGSLADLAAVVGHYSDLDPARLHADGEAILRPLNLPDAARSDLEAFLRSLAPAGCGPPADGCDGAGQN